MGKVLNMLTLLGLRKATIPMLWLLLVPLVVLTVVQRPTALLTFGFIALAGTLTSKPINSIR